MINASQVACNSIYTPLYIPVCVYKEKWNYFQSYQKLPTRAHGTCPAMVLQAISFIAIKVSITVPNLRGGSRTPRSSGNLSNFLPATRWRFFLFPPSQDTWFIFQFLVLKSFPSANRHLVPGNSRLCVCDTMPRKATRLPDARRLGEIAEYTVFLQARLCEICSQGVS